MNGKFDSSRAALRKAVALLPSAFFTLGAICFAEETPTPAPSPTASVNVGDAISQQVQSVFTRTRNAVVRVEGRHGPFNFVGTGFFVDPSGLLLTNYLVGGDTADIVVTYGEMKFPAKRLLADPRTGIALLKVEGGKEFPFLLPGPSAKLGAGSPVLLVGYPMNLPVAPSLGLVASFDIQSPGCLFALSCIRANMAVQSGEAGGPLLNMEGQVVGIVIKGQENRAGLFALPIEAAEKIRRDYTRFGEIRAGQVGIVIDKAFTEGSAPAAIMDFVKDSAAESSGLQKGDIITSIGSKSIQSTADLLDACYFISPGDKVALTVDRHGQTVSFTIEATTPHPSQREEKPDDFEPAPNGIFMRTSD